VPPVWRKQILAPIYAALCISFVFVLLFAMILIVLACGLIALYVVPDLQPEKAALLFAPMVISAIFSALIVNTQDIPAQRRPAGTTTGRQTEVNNLPGRTEPPVEGRAEAPVERRADAPAERRAEIPAEVARAVLPIQDLGRDSTADAGTVSSRSPQRQPLARPQHPQANRPSVPDLSSYVESARIVQCPYCGDFWIDVAHSSSGYTFGCHSCGEKWDWRPSEPWPATIKINRREGTGPAGG
jgi:hypothetical protein